LYGALKKSKKQTKVGDKGGRFENQGLIEKMGPILINLSMGKAQFEY
jgi:hypothetical protein